MSTQMKKAKHPVRKLEKYYVVKIFPITQTQKGPPLMKHSLSSLEIRKLLLRLTD